MSLKGFTETIFSFWLTPNRCSSSTTKKEQDLRASLLFKTLWVETRTSFFSLKKAEREEVTLKPKEASLKENSSKSCLDKIFVGATTIVFLLL